MLFTEVIFNTYGNISRVFCFCKIGSRFSSFYKKLIYSLSRFNTFFSYRHANRVNTSNGVTTLSKIQKPCLIKKKQAGMTFIEVLIALFIMVTGILGAVAMQATAKKGSFDAMQRSLASGLAQDIVELMRNNDASTLALYTTNSPYGTGKITNPPTCNSNASLCTPAQMVTNDLYYWEQALMGANTNDGTNNTGGLMDATACIDVTNNEVTVVISWDAREKMVVNSDAVDCGSTGESRRQVVVEAFIY